MPTFPRDPFVATPTGFRRKIGPKSRYGTNDDSPAYGTGLGPQGAQSAMNARSSFSGQTRLGRPHAKTESRFATSMREADEVTAANKVMEAKEKQRAADAKAKQSQQEPARPPMEKARNSPRPSVMTTVSGMLDKAREDARRAFQKPKKPRPPLKRAITIA